LRRMGVGGRVAGGVDVLLHVVPDRVEVGLGLGVGVVVPKEIVGVCGVDRLRAQQVDGGELEPARQTEDRLVAAVDELTAVLAGLAVEPGGGGGVVVGAGKARGLVNGG